MRSCGCLDNINRGAICKHAEAVFLWWHLQSQLVDKAPVTNVSACEGADSSQFPPESLRAFCSKRRAGGHSGAVDTGLGAAMSSCAPNGPIPSTAACCAAAAVEPGRAIRRALEFGTSRNSKPRASSVPALEVPFHEPYPEPKSALKMSQSPAGPLAAEKRVRVVVADEEERNKSAVPVSSGGGDLGCFGMLQLRAKALRLNEGRLNARRRASPRAKPAASTACVEQTSSSTGAVPAAVLQSNTGFGKVLAVLDAVNSQETAVRVIDKAAPG